MNVQLEFVAHACFRLWQEGRPTIVRRHLLCFLHPQRVGRIDAIRFQLGHGQHRQWCDEPSMSLIHI